MREKQFKVRGRLPLEVALFLRKAHRVVPDGKKAESRNSCRNFRKNRKKYLTIAVFCFSVSLHHFFFHPFILLC